VACRISVSLFSFFAICFLIIANGAFITKLKGKKALKNARLHFSVLP
jgi:hypothetical protein